MSDIREGNRDGETAKGRTVHRMILFIADGEPNSLAARENLKQILAAETNCEIELQLVNVFEDFQTALEHGVLVTPCLLQMEPPPRVVIAGTLKDAERVRSVLRLDREVAP